MAKKKINIEEELKKATMQISANLGINLDLNGIDSRKFKRGKKITYGKARKIAEIKGMVFCGYTDYHRGRNRPEYDVWQLSIGDDSLLIDSGSFRMCVDLEDFGTDRSIFDHQDEYARIELYEAIPK